MCKDELTSEELFLKEGDHSAKLPLVDVHDSVMKAIGLGNDRLMMEQSQLQVENTPDVMQSMEPVVEAKRYRKRTMGRHMGRWAAALILIALLGGSYSLFIESPGQAAKFQYEVLPYQPLVVTEEGGKVVKSNKPIFFSEEKVLQRQESKEERLFREKYSEAYDAVEKLLLPEEFASYVLRQEKAGGESPMIGVVNRAMSFKDYSSYAAKAKRYIAPDLKQPEYMPEGYVFDQAWIIPYFEIKEKELLALSGGFKLEGGYRVSWRKEPLGSINFDISRLSYRKGQTIVNISAKRLKEKTGIAESLMWTKNTIMENILVNGTQLIYMDHSRDGKVKLGYKYKLVWADPKNNMLYDLTASPESSLTKEEIIRIAAGMMN
ncbi:DUF4367 domain-containing protein [Paenibacillus graminis]|uniref:DUF4367 domain-containing protein n=1 Tax=Paenibacillus graminis TaxID=189425 RepID=A0A089NF60_9BACL|nr:DUF4367 domain-containing protein [Paenibacillus graminis]AIQ67639.1 hypothetical protein PGRAT_08330 [Paenibacillus graminis]